jgi:hypothetical protein
MIHEDWVVRPFHLIDQKNIRLFFIQQREIGRGGDLLRKPHQYWMRLLAQLVSPKHSKTQAQKRKSKAVFPGLWILFDIPKRAERRQDSMYVAWE